MSNLVRVSRNNRGGADPALWEKPVNQASKWLAAKSGSFRIMSAGGSVALSGANNDYIFLLNVWVGDGGSANIGGTSGNNTVRVSRTGNTVSVTCQTNNGNTNTKTFTTNVGADRWSNVYIKSTRGGIFNNQITITAMVDFNTTQTLQNAVSSTLVTNGKTLTCDSLSGWAWFGSVSGGFFGWGGTSTIPITDVKYREAFINNATWDIDPNTAQHDWQRPADLKTMRAWLIQGGGGSGGKGGTGASGQEGRDGTSSQPDGCTDGTNGTAGSSGGNGGKGGNNGANGQPGSGGQAGGSGGRAQVTYRDDDGDGWQEAVSCTPGDGGSAGAGGSGGDGGAGGRGVMKQVSFTQAVVPARAGAKGAKGSNGSQGGNGGPGGDGAHTTFGNETTATATDLSTPTIKFGATEFEHGLGGSDQDGGVVVYLIW